MAFAILAALLFGLAAPLSKRFLTGIPPIEASGLLYLGAGLALGGSIVLGGRWVPRRSSSALPGPWASR